MKTNRKEDMNAEQEVAEFLDRFLYKELCKDGQLDSFKRHEDKASQLDGIDVELVFSGNPLIVDEKAALYYSNTNLTTFAFEIDSIQHDDGKLLRGWFLRTGLKTVYYMLVWLTIACQKQENKGPYIRKEIKELSSSDIIMAEAMLISKEKIYEYVRQYYGSQYLLDLGAEMRNNNDAIHRLDDGMSLRYTSFLGEKPVNLLIPKNTLKEIAEHHYLISRYGYAEVGAHRQAPAQSNEQ